MEKNKILVICKMAAEITNEEIDEVRKIIQGQIQYNNPLRMGTTGKQNALGRYNQAVLDAFLNLKAVIDSGADL